MSVLRLSGVGFAYVDAVPLLESVNIELTAGWTALVGANGAGKTTLSRALVRKTRQRRNELRLTFLLCLSLARPTRRPRCASNATRVGRARSSPRTIRTPAPTRRAPVLDPKTSLLFSALSPTRSVPSHFSSPRVTDSLRTSVPSRSSQHSLSACSIHAPAPTSNRDVANPEPE
jgi:energy-coupling factor transporter ATP-binding protein EcfA2